MRDTFPAKVKRPSWWEWMNLDTADLIQVDGKAFDPATTPVDKVVPEAQFPRLRGQVAEMKTRYGASTWFWFSQPRDVAVRMTFTAAKETKTIAVIAGAPGQDYFYVVYPRKDGRTRAGLHAARTRCRARQDDRIDRRRLRRGYAVRLES